MAFIYEGNKRRAISFPLGGIGSGCIGLSAMGNWSIGRFLTRQTRAAATV